MTPAEELADKVFALLPNQNSIPHFQRGLAALNDKVQLCQKNSFRTLRRNTE